MEQTTALHRLKDAMTLKRLLSRLALVVAVCVPLLTSAPAAAQGLSVIRDQEIEDTLHLFSRPVFIEAGLTPASVRFVLVQNSTLNAFVAGGQNIFLHTGLILETDNADELIGVIAHETGHISSGHLIRTQAAIEDMTIQAILANVLGLAAAVGAKSGEAAVAAAMAGRTFAERGILRHSRIQESSADQAGVRFLEAARLPVGGFLSFMEKLASQELLPESQQTEYIRTHPLTRDRIDFLKNTLQTHKTTSALPDGWVEKHARMKAKLFGYLFPEQAVRDMGDSIPSRYGRAIALYRRGQTRDALPVMDSLIQQEPANPWFQELKAQVLFESGRIDDAIPLYAEAVRLAPRSALIRTAYAHALLETRTDKDKRQNMAIEQLQRSLSIEPLSAQSHRLLAIAYGRQGKEGMSRLHLAEAAVLRNKMDDAAREAVLAQRNLPAKSAAWLRAQDILDVVSRNEKKKN